MSNQRAINYEQEIGDVFTSMAEVHEVMDRHGFDRNLHHLVQLRASQINRCGFCVKMHTREARKDGETNDRLDRVIVWNQVRDFSGREKAALAWTDALTILDPNTDIGELRSELQEHFSDKEISILTATVAMINLWNRINISRH